METSSVVPCPSCGKRNRVPAVTSGTPRCAACQTVLPWLVNATDADFAAVTRARIPVLVDLWAPWCSPCRSIAPLLAEAAADFAGRLKVVKVNVDDSPGVSQRFGAQSIPTILILKNGGEVSRQVGALPRPALRAWLERELGEAKSARTVR